jgi:hypothetical protein
MFHQEGDSVAVVAPKAAQPRHPAWFHNLGAHPETTIEIGALTNRLRTEGTEYLLSAGHAVGVRRFVAQSNARVPVRMNRRARQN